MWTKSKCVAVYKRCREKMIKHSAFENEETQFKKVVKSINQRIKQQVKRGCSALDISRYEYNFFSLNNFNKVMDYYANLGFEIYEFTHHICISWEVVAGR